MVPAVAILDDLKQRPRCYLADGGTWPDGPLESNAPLEARVAQHIAVVLRDCCKARRLSSYKAADAASMSQGALYNVLSGRAWPNSSVVARIERNLAVVLWPPSHDAEMELCPKLYLDSGDWPYGELTPDAPPEAGIAQTISKRFRPAFTRFDSDVARGARRLHVSQGAIEALLHGTAWLDWPTIARIERNLRVRLLGLTATPRR